MIYIPGSNFKLKQNSKHPLFQSNNHYYLVTISKIESGLKYVFENKTKNVNFNLKFDTTEEADTFIHGLDALSK